MGAWIETYYSSVHRAFVQSHPVWVRGLKLNKDGFEPDEKGSHPVWVRGLKQREFYAEAGGATVAPCMGAWIET